MPVWGSHAKRYATLLQFYQANLLHWFSSSVTEGKVTDLRKAQSKAMGYLMGYLVPLECPVRALRVCTECTKDGAAICMFRRTSVRALLKQP